MIQFPEHFDDSEPSMEEPFDWYFITDGEGIATGVSIEFFIPFVATHNIFIEVCGVEFNGETPFFDVSGAGLEIEEAKPEKHYAVMRMKLEPNFTDSKGSLTLQFNRDFAFTIFEKDTDGNLTELESDTFNYA